MRKKQFIVLLTAIFSFWYCQLVLADFTVQRHVYLQAKAALKRGDSIQFRLLSATLIAYPLYPYLRYAELSGQLSYISEQQATEFLKNYSDTSLAAEFRANWLALLAKQQRWPLFIKYYQPTSDHELQYSYMRALAATGKLTTGQVWQRLTEALAGKDKVFIKNLISLLPAVEQGKAQLWQKVIEQPTLVVTQPDLFLAYPSQSREIVMDGIKRLAEMDPAQAMQQWPMLLKTYALAPLDRQPAIKAIGISLSRINHPAANSWLAQVDPSMADQVVREWRVRNAIAQHDWPQVNEALAKLTNAERTSACWQYWQARALAVQNQWEVAQAIYRELMQRTNYYGLLASQQLQQTYQPSPNTYPVSAGLLAQVQMLPAIQRARELYYLGFMTEARHEWEWALKTMSASQLHAAAVLATQWQWYEQAISALVRTSDGSDLVLRFPLVYSQYIVPIARQMDLNPAWLYAIIRQESTFMSDAKSPVGAVGLMQLMPGTAKALMRSAHYPLGKHYNLVDANTNIQIGSLYLKQLLKLYNGNPIVAAAAYNRGPGALRKWLALRQQLSDDAWIEVLPWRETREYVKSVWFNTAIYQWRLTQEELH